jgi:hypothetical protein
MKFFVVIGFLFCSFHCFGQNYMNYKKAKVKKKVADFYVEKNIKVIITETDSSITFLTNDTAYSPSAITYFFNAKGRCYKETHTGNCQECFQNLFLNRTNQKMYDYKKAGENLFISKPFWNVTIIVHTSQPYSFSIIQGYYTRNQQKKKYKNLV